MVTFTFRNTPWRVDDEAHKAIEQSQTITLACEDGPVTILESALDADKKSAPEAA
jgi:hypothetical protein